LYLHIWSRLLGFGRQHAFRLGQGMVQSNGPHPACSRAGRNLTSYLSGTRSRMSCLQYNGLLCIPVPVVRCSVKTPRIRLRIEWEETQHNPPLSRLSSKTFSVQQWRMYLNVHIWPSFAHSTVFPLRDTVYPAQIHVMVHFNAGVMPSFSGRLPYGARTSPRKCQLRGL